jgi:transposase-like protein
MARYSAETKAQVLKEIAEVGSITVVANKHGISPKTVHHWVKSSKASGDRMAEYKQVKSLHQQLKDKDLEIRVLKELLKKTVQVWSNEDQSAN